MTRVIPLHNNSINIFIITTSDSLSMSQFGFVSDWIQGDNSALPNMANFEISPADSLLSAPSENYPSLFTGELPDARSSSVNPCDVQAMTPVSTLPTEPLSQAGSPSPEESSEQPKKKRKSWGQVLPEPKTNLPPRKRAKTEDEKEQRRVERVLRNRRAAQHSRERKREEADKLQKQNEELKARLDQVERQNAELQQQLQLLVQNPQAQINFSSTINATFTGTAPQSQPDPIPETINMAKLSPPREIEESQESEQTEVNPQVEQPELAALQLPAAPASDVTQHSAAMLCDLQCQSEPASNRDAQAWQWMVYLTSILRASILSAWSRPLTQISGSLRTGSPLVPSPTILTTILWLVTRTPTSKPSSRRSRPTSSSRTTAILRSLGWRTPTAATTSGTSTRVTNLKVKLLRKILSSSPMLARPLLDATLVALRLTSSGAADLTVNTPVVVPESNPVDGELTQLFKQMSLPRREVLLALAFTIQVEMKKMDRRQRSSSIGGDLKSRYDRPSVTGSVALHDAAA